MLLISRNRPISSARAHSTVYLVTKFLWLLWGNKKATVQKVEHNLGFGQFSLKLAKDLVPDTGTKVRDVRL